MTLFHELYDRWAERNPSAPAFVCHRTPSTRHEGTYAELAARSLVLAQGLRRALDSLRSGLTAAAPSPAALAAGADAVVAVRLPRVHADFLPVILAGSRCGATLVPLSTDLQDRALENDRARRVFEELRPCFLVVEASRAHEVEDSIDQSCTRIIAVEQLSDGAKNDSLHGAITTDQTPPPLFFLFTGGTTRGRCVAITHDMFRHESARYPECLRLPRDVRVLGHTSLYWGASALGQLSIAVAYGACVVLTDVVETDDLREVITKESVTVLGIVPNQLRAMSEDPVADLPSIRAIFTWGEALPRAVAECWRDHPAGSCFRELLISTEYWLSLYAAPFDPTLGAEARYLQPTKGVQVLVLGGDGRPVAQGVLGELLLAGPMVTSGYVATSGGSHNGRDINTVVTGSDGCSPFREVDGVRYFCTGDLVRLAGGAQDNGGRARLLLEYRGRADMTAKDNGKWVDLRDVEERLQRIAGIGDVVLLPDPHGGPQPHACMSLERDADCATALRTARGALPRGTQLHVLDHLPRHPVTQKVDLRKLKALVHTPEWMAHGASWPLLPGAPAPHYAAVRLHEKWTRHALWTLAAAAVAASWDLQAALRLFGRRRTRRESSRLGSLPSGAGFVLLPLMHLALVHALERWPSIVYSVTRPLPFGVWGMMLATFLGRGLATPRSKANAVCSAVAAVWAACGFACGAPRGRLTSFFVVFWVGIGHRLDFELGRWLRLGTWRDHVRWQLQELLIGMPRAALAAALAPATRALVSIRTAISPAAGDVERLEEHAPMSWSGQSGLGPCRCKWSGCEVSLEWPPRQPTFEPPPSGPTRALGPLGGFLNGQGEPVCWQSWPVEAAAALNNSQQVAKLVLEAAARVANGESGQKPGVEMRPEPSSEPEPELTGEDATPPKQDAQSEVPARDDVRGWDRAYDCSWWSTSASESNVKRLDEWWWYNKVRDTVTILPAVAKCCANDAPSSGSCAEASAIAAAAGAQMDPQLRKLCRCIAEVSNCAASCDPTTPLHGLDSLSIALLTARLRAEFGATSLSVGAVRRAADIAELLEKIHAAVRQSVQGNTAPLAATNCADGRLPHSRGLPSARDEYALFFSPGQAFPMGGWVMRNDTAVDVGLLEEAARRLVDRHEALRTQIRDPLRLLSFCLDTGILFTLVARRLDHGAWLARSARRVVSWALRTAWPRVTVAPRAEVYARHACGAPLTVHTVAGQEELETAAKERRTALGQSDEPVDIALLQLEAQLTGLWVYGRRGGGGDFAIVPDPRGGAVSDGLVFVDREFRQAGKLVGPGDPAWRAPPHGFAALLSTTLAPEGSGVVWLRLNRPRELVVLYKPDMCQGTRWKRYVAFRMPGGPSTPSTFSFLVVHAMHSLADGQSYEAIVGDLLNLYATPGGKLPCLPSAHAELQRRLYAALGASDPLAFPQQCSLRGSMWRCRCRGYSHAVDVEGVAAAALRRAALVYSAPPDVLLLAFVIASIARSSGKNNVPLTLYVPNRDGPGETGYVGLFSDWRDIEVSADEATATVLGVILEVSHVLRNRRWGLFNALRKPEVTMVNFQSFDKLSSGSRAGFVQVGEELWRNGDRLRHADTRRDELGQVPQPLSITIEQQDSECWCVHLSMDYNKYPPSWARKFVKSFEDAFQATLTQPLLRVHRNFPVDFY